MLRLLMDRRGSSPLEVMYRKYCTSVMYIQYCSVDYVVFLLSGPSRPAVQ